MVVSMAECDWNLEQNDSNILIVCAFDGWAAVAYHFNSNHNHGTGYRNNAPRKHNHETGCEQLHEII